MSATLTLSDIESADPSPDQIAKLRQSLGAPAVVYKVTAGDFCEREFNDGAGHRCLLGHCMNIFPNYGGPRAGCPSFSESAAMFNLLHRACEEVCGLVRGTVWNAVVFNDQKSTRPQRVEALHRFLEKLGYVDRGERYELPPELLPA